MLVLQLITANYPFIKVTDDVALALHLMEQNHVLHLPVVSEERKFLGLVAKDDLLQASQNDAIDSLADKWIGIALHPHDHFIIALKMMQLHNISLVAVTNDQAEWLGAITQSTLIQACSKFMGVDQPGGIITFETDKKNLSFSEIARLVETNDAYITQLNTQTNPESGLIEVCIKINRTEISTVVATLQRYDYAVKYYSGEESFENELKENYDLLMAYLNI